MTTRNTDSSSNLESLLQATELFMFKAIGETKAEKLTELMHYHLESGGARLRARLALSAGIALNVDQNVNVALSACCELIHNASLLHDDIQDGDKMRRGREAAWFKFDVNSALCAGTLMLSSAYRAVSSVPVYAQQLVAHLHQRTSDLISGQTMDLSLTTQHIDVQTYLDVAIGKSGSLLALPFELVMISANQAASLPIAKAAGESFAVAYQIADDISDLQVDLSHHHTNIIGILQSTGLNRQLALAQASRLAQEHLNLAASYACQLPANSGAVFIPLCEALAETIGTEPLLSCEII
jgi:geranylgeranyl pyrophosphate synthase